MITNEPTPLSPETLRDNVERLRTDLNVVRNELAQALDVWRAILRVESLSIDDNFFERGGDSIVSIRVIAAMRERGWKIDARQIFQHQTIRALAPTAVRLGGEAAPAAESRDPLPLTPLQRMFLASQPASPSHFNQAVLFRLDAAADTAALHRALRAVQHAHPALRSRFDADGQRITADADVPLDVYRADGATRDDRARHVTQRCDDVQRRIDIAAGPVFRAARITDVDTDDRLLLVAHHLVVDAVSWHIIASDLESAYAAARRGDVPAVAPELVGPTAFRAAAAIDLVPERLSAESSYGDRVTWLDPGDATSVQV